jgi:hypothetical protein
MKPTTDAGGLVPGGVVEHEVHTEMRGDGGVDGLEELQELEPPLGAASADVLRNAAITSFSRIISC